MKTLAIVGSLSRDRVDGSAPRVGGGAYHCARALRALGRRAVIVTRSAEADRTTLLTPLVALGLPVRWRAGTTTAAFTIENVGDERRMVVDAIADPWTPGDVRSWVGEAIADVAWVHASPLNRRDFPAETLAELARGRRLSLDGQGLVRPASTGLLELDAEFDPAMLHHVSVLKLASDEAEALGVTADGRSIRELGVDEVVLTLGSSGCIVFAKGRTHHVPAVSVQGNADATGAGDAFSAVYVACRAGGTPPVTAARRASSLVADLLSGRIR
jgi:sugar/nucleoside kinase (ribokinase family)